MNDNLDHYLKYTDEDGNEYALVSVPYEKNSHACHGCAFKFGGSNACNKAKSCTPVKWHPGRMRHLPVVMGRHVWKLTRHWQDNPELWSKK